MGVKRVAARALGLDFGGVLASSAGQDLRRIAASDPMSVPLVPGALQAVSELLQLFDGRVWVISKASPATGEWTRAWLAAHGFLGGQMLAAERIEIVQERIGKRERCLAHGITHFVDDGVKNLRVLRGRVDWLCLFGEHPNEPRDGPWHHADDWSVAMRLIR